MTRKRANFGWDDMERLSAELIALHKADPANAHRSKPRLRKEGAGGLDGRTWVGLWSRMPQAFNFTTIVKAFNTYKRAVPAWIMEKYTEGI